MSARVLSERSFSTCILSGMHAYTASPQKSWILDLGVLSHMTGNKENFMSVNMSNTYSSVKIVDGSHSLVLENGVVHATLSLIPTGVLFVPKFLVSLLSISQFTKYNNCKITFFCPFYCVF